MGISNLHKSLWLLSLELWIKILIKSHESKQFLEITPWHFCKLQIQSTSTHVISHMRERRAFMALLGPSALAEHCRWIDGRNLLWADPLFRNYEEQSIKQTKVISLLRAAAEYRRAGENDLSVISNKQDGSRARAWHIRLQDVFVEGPEDLLSLGLTSSRAQPGSVSGLFFPHWSVWPRQLQSRQSDLSHQWKKPTNFWGNSFRGIFYILRVQLFQHALECELLYHFAVIEFQYFTFG